MTDKKTTDKQKTKFALSRKERIGGYTFIITLILLALLVVINLLVSALPKSLLFVDTSANKLYSISSGTKAFLGRLDREVTINWICQGGEEDPQLSLYLKKYTDLNSRIKLSILDPIKNPAVIDKYTEGMSAAPSNFSLIIESERRYTLINFENLFYYYNEYLAQNYGLSEPVSFDFYDYYYQYFYTAEYSGYATETYFYGEDIITKAVEYVALEKIPHIYITETPGGYNFSETMLSFLSGNNVEYEGISLSSADAIPSDASCVVLYAPENDLTAAETRMLRDYLDAGGNLLLITSPDNVGMANLMSLVEPYGVTATPGIVYDENTGYYKTNQYNLKPGINSEHEITYPPTSNQLGMTMPASHGIKIGENTSGAEVTALLTTSSSAYSLAGEDRSEAGELALGVAITYETNEGEARIAWYSSAEAFTDATIQANDYGNYYYLFYSLYWMNETYDSALSDIVGIPTAEPLLDGLTQTSVMIWGATFAGIIPIVVIVSGLVVWIRRRRR